MSSSINNFVSSYFSGCHELFLCNQRTSSQNISTVAKVVSYCTVIIPLLVGSIGILNSILNWMIKSKPSNEINKTDEKMTKVVSNHLNADNIIDNKKLNKNEEQNLIEKKKESFDKNEEQNNKKSGGQSKSTLIPIEYDNDMEARVKQNDQQNNEPEADNNINVNVNQNNNEPQEVKKKEDEKELHEQSKSVSNSVKFNDIVEGIESKGVDIELAKIYFRHEKFDECLNKLVEAMRCSQQLPKEEMIKILKKSNLFDSEQIEKEVNLNQNDHESQKVEKELLNYLKPLKGNFYDNDSDSKRLNKLAEQWYEANKIGKYLKFLVKKVAYQSGCPSKDQKIKKIKDTIQEKIEKKEGAIQKEIKKMNNLKRPPASIELKCLEQEKLRLRKLKKMNALLDAMMAEIKPKEQENSAEKEKNKKKLREQSKNISNSVIEYSDNNEPQEVELDYKELLEPLERNQPSYNGDEESQRFDILAGQWYSANNIDKYLKFLIKKVACQSGCPSKDQKIEKIKDAIQEKIEEINNLKHPPSRVKSKDLKLEKLKEMNDLLDAAMAEIKLKEQESNLKS